jgi:hypothetical protein
MSDDSRPNEWSFLKEQFYLLVQAQKNVGVDSTEMFDVQFHSRFAELLNRIVEHNSETGYIDWSRR